MSEPASKRWPTPFTAVGRDDNLDGKVGAGVPNSPTRPHFFSKKKKKGIFKNFP
jgi:hypothetical protein